MTYSDLTLFFNEWRKLGLIYKGMGMAGNLHFPEPLQKEIIMSFYDTNLKLDPSKTYDFLGNVELKSSTNVKGGCTPFSRNQTQCSRILYMEINEHITVYELNQVDVKNINAKVSSGKLNITLNVYKSKATKVTQII